MVPHGFDRDRTPVADPAEDDAVDVSGPIDPGIIKEGYMQFLTDLDELLGDGRNRRKLAAYHGKRRICVAADMNDILKAAAREKIPVDELMIESIVLQPDATRHLLDCHAESDRLPPGLAINA
jgi:hypothetical protein